MTTPTTLRIDAITADPQAQPRAQMNMFVVDEYAQAMREGATFAPVVVFCDGQRHWLADGFHRLQAARQAGLVEIAAEVREGGKRDAILYAVGANAHHGLRRTNADKRRAVMAMLGDSEWSQWSNNEIARRCNVSLDLVNRMRNSLNDSLSERVYITKHGTQATMNTANIGSQQPITPAARDLIRDTPLADRPQELRRIAQAPPPQQVAIAERIATGQAKGFTDARRQISRENMQAPPPLSGKHRIFYADPPWKYNDSGLDEYGHAERHYPTMTTAELCELDVQAIAEDDAVLFLWTTSPMLPEALKVAAAWGFKYKTSFVWDKVGHNYGHYNSVRHELLLVCTRGSCTPDVPKLFDSVVTVEKTGRHSQKPERFREIIDTLYTRGSRIELFARETVSGWCSWGNQV